MKTQCTQCSGSGHITNMEPKKWGSSTNYVLLYTHMIPINYTCSACKGRGYTEDIEKIGLSSGAVVTIDAEDLALVSGYTWYESLGRNTTYAECVTGGRKNKKFTRMHRLIMGAESGQYVDHINGNGLDNRRSNLRICTNAENQMNRGLSAKNTSGYKGVSLCKQSGKWVAKIKVSGVGRHLGRFVSPVDAALAYDKAAVEHFGEFAYTNFPKDEIHGKAS